MPAVIKSVTFDCADALVLARFWAAALGADVDKDATAERAYVQAAGWGGPNMIQQGARGQGSHNRLHLDIRTSGEWTDPIETRRTRVDAEASRLAGLGATITGALSEEWLYHYAVGMKDPEGNEFDIN